MFYSLPPLTSDLVQQQIALAKKPHILIGTPGRVLYHLENTKGFGLENAKFLVLDEADRLLNLDFEGFLLSALPSAEIDKILHAMPSERNTYLFSATMTKKVEKLQRASLRNPVKVEANTKYTTPKQLVEQYLFIPFRFKEVYLTFILNEMAGHSAIVFTTTRKSANKLAYSLRNLGFSVVGLHGEMSQAKRLGSLNKFKAQEREILIATDLGSRGLDIPIVDLVINFDVPQNSKDYIHRVGRTARANKTGRAVTLVTQYDIELFQRIEQLIGKKMPEFPHDEASVMVLAERVTEAMRLATGQIKEGTKKKEAKGKGKRAASADSTQTFKKRKGVQKKKKPVPQD